MGQGFESGWFTVGVLFVVDEECGTGSGLEELQPWFDRRSGSDHADFHGSVLGCADDVDGASFICDFGLSHIDLWRGR